MKKLENLKGAQQLSKNEQQCINGGGARPCPVGMQIAVIPVDEQTCLDAGLIWQQGYCYACY